MLAGCLQSQCRYSLFTEPSRGATSSGIQTSTAGLFMQLYLLFKQHIKFWANSNSLSAHRPVAFRPSPPDIPDNMKLHAQLLHSGEEPWGWSAFKVTTWSTCLKKEGSCDVKHLERILTGCQPWCWQTSGKVEKEFSSVSGINCGARTTTRHVNSEGVTATSCHQMKDSSEHKRISDYWYLEPCETNVYLTDKKQKGCFVGCTRGEPADGSGVCLCLITPPRKSWTIWTREHFNVLMS